MPCSSSARNSRRRCRRSMARDVLGAAADYHVEKPEYGDFMFPKLFGQDRADLHGEIWRFSEEALAMVAWKNYAHAKLNPLAQMRDADVTLRLRLAGLREESVRRPASEGYRLLADH